MQKTSDQRRGLRGTKHLLSHRSFLQCFDTHAQCTRRAWGGKSARCLGRRRFSKRTLGHPRQSAASQGPQQGPRHRGGYAGRGRSGLRSRFVNHERLGWRWQVRTRSWRGLRGGRISTRASGRFHFPPAPGPFRGVAASEPSHRKQDGTSGFVLSGLTNSGLPGTVAGGSLSRAHSG